MIVTLKIQDEQLTNRIILRKTVVFNKKKNVIGFQQRYLKNNKLLKINYFELKINDLKKMLEKLE